MTAQMNINSETIHSDVTRMCTKRTQIPGVKFFHKYDYKPWKYFPQTRHAYTLILDRETEHNFSKSKSNTCLLIVSRYGHRRYVFTLSFVRTEM